MYFFNELKRRNVLRIGAAYVVVSWLLIQVAETIFPLFGFDETPARIVVVVLAIGLVPALIFAWAFELTPEGLKKESEVDRAQSITPRTGKKLDHMIMVVLALALGYFAIDKFVLDPQREAASRQKQSEQLALVAEEAHREGRSEALVESYGENSIAVLAFQDMSQDQDQEYLSDGIAEELLNLLARIPELRVISRSSSFSYKGKDINLAEVAKELNVAHILEGSVRKAGNQVRITAQLIDARSDTHLWSHTYDRTLDDIFAIQDEISATVVDQLKITLLDDMPTTVEINPEAYALYLHARHLGRQHTTEAWEQSNALIDQALSIDPGFAAPWAVKSSNYANMTAIGLITRDEGVKLARQAAENALEIDPGSGEVYAKLGWLAMVWDGDLSAAARYYERALELDPLNISNLANAASMMVYLRRYDTAIAMREYVTPRNPLSAVGYFNFAAAYLAAGRLDEAILKLQSTLRLSPKFGQAHIWLGKVLMLKGDAQAGLEMTQQAPSEVFRLIGQALCLFALGRVEESDAALAELIEKHEESFSYDIASIWAYRNEPEQAFAWISKAEEYKDPGLGEPPYDPLFANIMDDPRWMQFLKRIGKSPAQLEAIKFEVTIPQ